MSISTGIITTVGIPELAKLAKESGNNPIYIAYGTDDTTQAASDETLGSEVDRAEATVSRVSGALRLVHEFENEGSAAVTVKEVGVFTASTGGTMVYRAVISASCQRTVAIGETYSVTIDLLPQQGSW